LATNSVKDYSGSEVIPSAKRSGAMHTQTLCPNCQQPMPADALEGMCPACLLLNAFGSGVADPRRTVHSSPHAATDVSQPPPAVSAPDLAGTRFGDYELMVEIARG